MTQQVFGLLNLDKPLGLTSHDVVDRVRRQTGVKKVGHAGTLDPQATGVLILCLGPATRLSEYIMDHPKVYRAHVTLGAVSNTYDSEGDITPTPSSDTPPTAAQIEAALPAFKGYIQQVPPMYSAVKQGGEKLYEKARRGEEVEREPRQVAIYRLSIEVYDYPHLTLTVRCSPGTYIRSLAHDLGQSLGCGAYLGGLRRTSSGENFTAENALPLDQLERDIAAGDWLQHVVNVRAGLSQMPYIELNNQQERVIRNGGSIQLGISNRGLIQGWTDEGLFVGILKRNGEDDATANWKAEKVFNLETDEQE